ncbi:hypothetical protein FNV43_RR05031 [Rhamnella rubrinervis]|uniref:FAD-binding domain-containing protein n=1 Tax=Rhamnella rubrinervis TaxID=2594499 RepID=A0A8K0MQU8_9ROSA|nr:hypothetical protein FNV43_RR05031 [Rhamnella rubrinervis]
MEMVEDVVIVGGGVAGLATAMALKRIGVEALVLERGKELRTTGSALTLMPNAWVALDALGVSHELTSIWCWCPTTRAMVLHHQSVGAPPSVRWCPTTRAMVPHRQSVGAHHQGIGVPPSDH